MRLVIDETSWKFDVLTQDECIEKLEAMLDVLDDAQSHGNHACYSEDLFHTQVWGEKLFYDLYDPKSKFHIPRNVQERVASLFNSLQKWQDLDTEWPPSFEVSIDQHSPEEAASIAWAHTQTRINSANSIACVAFPHIRQSGESKVTVNKDDQSLWFLANDHSYRCFFRWLIIETTTSPAEMAAHSLSAFPSVDFVEGAFNGIKDMSKPYRELVRSLVSHLSAFSDQGARIFSGPRERIAFEFGPFGVDISDENGNTKSNAEARRLRTRNFKGKEITFWWHSKLGRDRDRIHIHLEDGRIVIGIFCRHL